MAGDDRTYDLVLWGATGFTGQFVAEHLADGYDETELDWAIAGRDPEKLRRLRDDLAGIDSGWESLDILTGDAFDRESLDAIAERTRVICATVGPYAEYGTNVVEACVEHGTHYCDLTGELHWMRRMIDEHHEDARERGVRIVHGCGFDSIPSDLGTLLVQSRAEDRFGARCSAVDAYVTTSSFGMSGGTAASFVGTYEAMAGDPEVRRVVESPYSLAPPGERSGPDETPQARPAYDDAVDQWTAPFLMADINEKVVRRSNALLGYPWGDDFRYREATPTGEGVSGAALAATMSLGLGIFESAMSVSPLRRLLARFVLPAPGEGPSRAEIEDASFEVRLVGTGSADGDEFTVEGRVAADSHFGYGATAWMLGEAAVCLARDEPDTPLDGGVLTPASGIGLPLVDRLRDAGMTFAVE